MASHSAEQNQHCRKIQELACANVSLTSLQGAAATLLSERDALVAPTFNATACSTTKGLLPELGSPTGMSPMDHPP